MRPLNFGLKIVIFILLLGGASLPHPNSVWASLPSQGSAQVMAGHGFRAVLPVVAAVFPPAGLIHPIPHWNPNLLGKITGDGPIFLFLLRVSFVGFAAYFEDARQEAYVKLISLTRDIKCQDSKASECLAHLSLLEGHLSRVSYWKDYWSGALSTCNMSSVLIELFSYLFVWLYYLGDTSRGDAAFVGTAAGHSLVTLSALVLEFRASKDTGDFLNTHILPMGLNSTHWEQIRTTYLWSQADLALEITPGIFWIVGAYAAGITELFENAWVE